MVGQKSISSLGPTALYPTNESQFEETAFQTTPVKELDVHTNQATVEAHSVNAGEEICFEKTEQDLMKFVVVLLGDKQTLSHLLARKTREQHIRQIQLHAGTYRNVAPILYAVGIVTLQTGSILCLLVPKLPITCQEGFNRLTRFNIDPLHVGRFCNDHGCVDVAMMSTKELRKTTDIAHKALSGGDQMVQTVSKLDETRQQGTRVEAQAESENLRQDNEARSGDKARNAQEISDGLRQLRDMQQQSHGAQSRMASFNS